MGFSLSMLSRNHGMSFLESSTLECCAFEKQPQKRQPREVLRPLAPACSSPRPHVMAVLPLPSVPPHISLADQCAFPAPAPQPGTSSSGLRNRSTLRTQLDPQLQMAVEESLARELQVTEVK